MALVDQNRIKASIAEDKVVNRPGGIMQPKFSLGKVVEKPSVFNFDYWREEKAPLLAAWMKMDPNEQDRPDPGLTFANLAPFKPMEDLFPRTSVGWPKDEPKAITTFAPEGGDLIGRLDGQLGYSKETARQGDGPANAVAAALGRNVAASDAAPVAAERSGLMARYTDEGLKLDGADKIALVDYKTPYDERKRKKSVERVGTIRDLSDTTESTSVKAAQTLLTELGYVTRGIDGVSGDGTASALRRFQENNNIPVTGALDEATKTKLGEGRLINYTPSNVVDTAFERFADIEARAAHLGETDYERVGITLAKGIVPDSGLQYKLADGSVIDIPGANSGTDRWTTLSNAGVTRANFNPRSVIIDGATKEGVRRGDFATDTDWTKAVITAFEDKLDDGIRSAVNRHGFDAASISDAEKSALLSWGWNVGSGKFSTAGNVYKELAEDNPSANVLADNMLRTFTVGGNVINGSGNRRAIDLNELLEANELPTIATYTPTILESGHAAFKYTYTDGTTRTVDTGTTSVDTNNWTVDVTVPVG